MHPTEFREVPEYIKKSKKLSILMPFLNEEDVIVQNTHKVREIMLELGINTDIVLIDDGSTDRSFEMLTKEFSKTEGVVLVRNYQNFGKGWAIKTGFEFSTGDYILFLDSDLELSPYHIPNFFKVMDEKAVDAVIGSKLHEDSVLVYPFIRRIMSKGYYGIIKLLFGLPLMDTQTGIKLFRREALEVTLPRVCVKKFAFDIELLMLLIKFNKKVDSAPIELEFTREKIGKMKLSTVFSMFNDTLAIFYRDKFLKFYDRELGEDKKYKYTIILFSDRNDEFEMDNLGRFLKIPGDNYNVVLLSNKPPGISDQRLKFFKVEEESYTLRLKRFLEVNSLDCDYAVFSSLQAFPDERFLFHIGRVLSGDNVGGAGGYVIPRRAAGKFEEISYSVIRSVFLNVNLNYRYRPLNAFKVVELQINGLFIKKSIVDNLDFNNLENIKLEHILSRQTALDGANLLYSPDMMLYQRFPGTLKEHLSFMGESARNRALQLRTKDMKYGKKIHDYEFVLSLVFLLFIPASVVIAIALKNWLYLLPLIGYFVVLLLNRLFFYGIVKGVLGFGVMVISQIWYGMSFLHGLVKRKPKRAV